MKTFTDPDIGTPEVDVAEAVRAVENEGAVLLDIREAQEWTRYHIPGAVHIPMGELARRAGDLDPDRTIVVYCQVGQRSLVSTDELLGLGFREVASLAGGIVAWAEAGRDISRGS